MRNRFSTIVALASAAVAAAFAAPVAASAEPLALLTGDGTSLQLLDSARPQQVSVLPLTGIGAGEVVSSIDVRPANGVLYAVSVEDDGATRTGRLYTINLATGVATQVGTEFSTTLEDTPDVSMDFNPTVDRIRVVSGAGDNLRVNPDTGALAATDTDLSDTEISAVAYDRNVAGATQTTLYALDTDADELVTIGGLNSTPSPNLGAVTPLAPAAPLGITVGADTGFDISSATNAAFLISAVTPQLRTVNLTTGATTPISGSFIGAPSDVAVLASSTIGLAGATATAEERNGKLDVTVTRLGATSVAGSVDFATTDGTAKAGSDYTAVSGTLKFAIGETTKTISIPLTDDGTGDPNENFTLTLSNAAGANLGTAVQTITIVETQVADKTAPNLVVSDLGIKAYKFFYPNGMYTTFSCDEACKVVYTVRLGTSTYIAKSTGELNKAGVGIVKAPNTLLGKARLSRAMKSSKAGKLVALFAIQATDANGNKKTVTRKFQIVR